MKRERLFAAPLLLLGLLLNACTPTPPPLPDATSVADSVAAALMAGDISGLPFAGSVDDAVKEYKIVTSGLSGALPADVEVSDIAYDQQAKTATVRVDQTYDLGTGWDFPSVIALTYAGSDGWQVVWAPSIVQPALDGYTRLSLSKTSAERGSILADDGTAIVYNRPVYRVGIDKTQVDADEAQTSARALAQLVGVDADSFAKAVANGGPKQFVIAITLRAEQMVDISGIPGALAQAATLPLGPSKTFAIGVLGTAGDATAEDIEKSGGTVVAGDTVGKSGLQASQNAALRGTDGCTVYLAPRSESDVMAPATPAPVPSGSPSPSPTLTEKQVLFQTDPVAGANVQTTLDIALQTKAESVLAGQDGIAAMVVLDPSTGAILAAANSPAAGGNSYATTGRYAPGSTFKVSTALALLRSGMTEDSKISCPVHVTIGSMQFKNVTGYAPSHNGSITLREAVAYSCNTAMVNGSTTLGAHDIPDAAASLGIGVSHDLGFPAFLGSVPVPTTDVEKAASSFGQAQIVASPLAMAAEAASVASGHTIVPYLLIDPNTGEPWQPTASATNTATAPTPQVTSTGSVDDATSEPTGTVTGNIHVTVSKNTSAPSGGLSPTQTAQPLTDDEASALRDMMAAVVSIGSGTILKGLADGAKTGTAEFSQDGQTLTHAWMIAFNGQYAIAAFVYTGTSGSVSAGPLIKAFLS